MKQNQADRRPARIWTTKRKVMGNLIPALVALPPAAVGVWLVWRSMNAVGAGLYWVIASVVLAWLAVNFCGLYANRKMRLELNRRLIERERELPDDAVFVGVATPTYAGWLDPHEDVGYLCIGPDRIAFWGDSLDLAVLRNEVTRIRYRANVHTMVGLGRWISVEGVSDGTRICLRIEPRERRTLIGNLRHSKALMRRLLVWLAGPVVQADATPK